GRNPGPLRRRRLGGVRQEVARWGAGGGLTRRRLWRRRRGLCALCPRRERTADQSGNARLPVALASVKGGLNTVRSNRYARKPLIYSHPGPVCLLFHLSFTRRPRYTLRRAWGRLEE